MKRRTLICGGRALDPATSLDRIADILVEDGRIVQIAPDPVPEHAEVIDAEGLVVAPGFIDPHAHLCEPGWEHRETIASGAQAGAAGGYTALCAMPDTDPVVDDPASVGFVAAAGRRARGARIFPAAAVSVGREGTQLTEFGELAEAGAIALTDAGRPVRSAMFMKLALSYAQSFDLPILSHPEDPTLVHEGVMHEGVVSTRLGLRGKPAVAEEIGALRDLALARATGGRLHLQRISTAAAVDCVRRARAEGVRVTAEATPHHLLLEHEAVQGYGTEYKVDPPLRTPADLDALVAALADGTIDCIATDHAPYTYDEKEQAFEDAPFGVVGLETAFAILHTRLVCTGRLPLATLLARMSAGPAQALALPGGRLSAGEVADLVLIDPALRWRIEPKRFQSRCRNTPFGGEVVQGRVVRTLRAGETVWQASPGDPAEEI